MAIKTGLPTGRPTMCTPAAISTIAKRIAAGDPIWVACVAAGVGRSVYPDWLTRGERGEEPFARFSAAIAIAQAEAIQNKLKLIHRAANRGSWQAATWWLERRAPQEFASVEKRALQDNLEEQARLQSMTVEQTIELMKETQAKLQARIDQLSEGSDNG